MGLKDRLDRLEALLSRRNADTGARERFKTKLAAISAAHRARRALGEEPPLEGQSMASLLGLVDSYPYDAVPPQVAQAARSKAQELSHGPHSAVLKMVRLCLEPKGYGRGNQRQVEAPAGEGRGGRRSYPPTRGGVRVFDVLEVQKEMFLAKTDLLRDTARDSEALDAVRNATPESRADFEERFGPIHIVEYIITPQSRGG